MLRPISRISFFFMMILLTHSIFAQNASDTSRFDTGISTGYSMISGYYAEELRNGPFFSFSAINSFSQMLYGFFNIAFSSHELSGSDGSQLYSVSLNMGPCFRASFLSGFGLYATPFARLEYLYLKAQKLDREENTVKPGFGGKAGLYVSLSSALIAQAGCDYSQIWLSGIPFKRITLHAGIAYNIFHLPTQDKIKASRAEEKLAAYSKADALYAEGVKYFEQGDVFSAKDKFIETIHLNKNHLEAQSYLEKITEIEKDYRIGLEYIYKKNYFAAIPPLDRAAKSMNDARKELEKTRILLAPQLSDLEKRGIRAYEMNEYGTCIELMTKVKLIDPKNKTASMYLPRAKQRLAAKEKLE